MQLQPQKEELPGERRYDADTLRQVTALAQELQAGSGRSFTAEQVEEIGEEVGLSRAFVREALRQLAGRQSQDAEARTDERRTRLPRWGLGVLWVLLLALAVACSSPPAAAQAGWAAAPLYFAAGSFFWGWLRAPGGLARGASRHASIGSAVCPPALFDLLVTLQRQLARQTRSRAYLSVAVSAAGEAVPGQTFERLEVWAQELTARAGGDCRRDSAGDLLCTFDSGPAAVGVARELQEGIGRFNNERNRAGAPLRVQCGIHEGPLPAEEDTAAELDAALAERASELRRRGEPGDILVSAELAAAALVELRSLAPLPQQAGVAPVFSWREGQRARQRP